MASRNGGAAKVRKFRFCLNRPFVLWLQPEQFGMAKGILEDREYEGLPLSREPQRILDLGANTWSGPSGLA